MTSFEDGVGSGHIDAEKAVSERNCGGGDVALNRS